MYQKIRDLREDNDMSQKQIAELLNISQTTYSKYELGKRNMPIESLIKLARFYNVSLDYLVGETDNPKKN